MSPFYLLHICNTAVGRALAQTSVPSSCVQYDPVNTSPEIIKNGLNSQKFNILFYLSKAVPASLHTTLTE